MDSGPTHDLNEVSRNLELNPEHKSLCMTLGPGGHLWWNNGFIASSQPFSPPYAGALITFFIPGLMYETFDAFLMILLWCGTQAYAGNNSEGGSVWCAAVHVYFLAEQYGTIHMEEQNGTLWQSSRTMSVALSSLCRLFMLCLL